MDKNSMEQKKDRLVSVIVPVYQAENYLDSCIQSIQAQSYQRLEIILVDDGSKDHSGKICDQYAAEDKRIQVIHKTNGGVSSARNAALEAVHGGYLCFMDSDDTVESDWIAELLKHMVPDGVSICGYSEVYEGKKIRRTAGDSCEKLSNHKAMEYLLRQEYFRGYLWNKMFDMNIIRAEKIIFQEELAAWEDVLFTAQYFRYAKQIYYCPVPLYNYFFRNTSATHEAYSERQIERTMDAVRVLEKLERFPASSDLQVQKQMRKVLSGHKPDISLVAEAMLLAAADDPAPS